MARFKKLEDFKAKHDPNTVIAGLRAELEEARKDSADGAAIKEIIGTITKDIEHATPPKWTLSPPKDSGSPGVPTLFLSDLHWGERVFPAQINGVNEFNLDIARRRLKYTVDTAVSLLRILDREMRYPGIVVPLGGDMISGNLHDELKATNQINSMPSVMDLWGHLETGLLHLADTFGAVFVPCVSGNHGRDTHKTWAKDRHHTSFDWLLYRILAKRFDNDPRFTFFVPDGIDALFKIYDVRYLLTHGDNLGRGGDGIIGHIGNVMRGDSKKRSRNAQIDMSYDVMLHGHYHTYSHATRVIGNGSLKGLDEFAFVNNFGFERPQQAMWITHIRNGITYRMPVFCDPAPKAGTPKWISYVADQTAKI